MPRNDYNELSTIIQTMIQPFMKKLQDLDDKVDRLNENYVTRADIKELTSTFVQKDYYSTRHEQLINRDLQMENMIRDLRNEYQLDLQKIHDRLESGKQQLEDRMNEQQQAKLSQADRIWLRWGQIMGTVAIVVTIIQLLSPHFHL